MKTIRTILFTLAAVLVGFGLFALISVKTEATLINRTLYWMFNSSYFILLVVGAAFLLIAIILTISLVAFKDDKTDEDEDEDELDIDLKTGEDDRETARASVNRIREPQRRPARANIPALFTVEEEDEEPDEDTEDADNEETADIRPPKRIEDGGEQSTQMFRRPMHMGEHRVEAPKPVEEEIKPVITEVVPEPAEKNEPEPEVRQPIMTRCIYCGEPIEKDNNFCPNCGRRR